MSPLEDISDDAVAEQLMKEAKESSIKYSAVGIDAFLPKRPANPVLKPNTRFLKTIIKEANSHNAALRNRDSSRNLASSCKSRVSHRSNSADRTAGVGSRRANLSGNSGANESDSGSRPHKRSSSRDHEHHHRRRRHRDDRQRRSRRSRSRSPQARHERGRNRRREENLSRSPEEKAESSRKQSRRHRCRSRSPRSDRRRTARPGSHEAEHSRLEQHGIQRTKPRRANRRYGDEDSDPLEDLIDWPVNPKQPIPRGRGAHKSRSHIDEHFSTSYDPANDVQLESAEDDDWDQALEALRDRQRWKELGANRLREAGFSEGEVSKWERGGEQREEDLRWKRSGEGREWDKGKVVTAAGDVETTVRWAK